MKDLTNEQLSSIWHAQAASGGRSFYDIIRSAIEADRELNGRTGEVQPAEQTLAVWGEDLRKCRDCADFGPICPNSGKPCGGDQHAAVPDDIPAILKKQAS